MRLLNKLPWLARCAARGRARPSPRRRRDGGAAPRRSPRSVVATVDKGDTAWMLTSSTVLVLFMILPGLALFYGGLVRAKNMLSVLMQCFVIACVMMIIWVVYGYSLALIRRRPSSAFIGGFSQAVPRGRHADRPSRPSPTA